MLSKQNKELLVIFFLFLTEFVLAVGCVAVGKCSNTTDNTIKWYECKKKPAESNTENALFLT